MSKRPKKLRLTRRDLDLLRDAHTFGLIVPDLIAPYRFAGKGPAAVTSTLRRLYGRPPRYLYLRPEPLDETRVYYRLTPRGARVIGASAAATIRPGKQSLIRRYALAWLVCCQSPHDRVLLDREAVTQLLIQPGRIPKHGYPILVDRSLYFKHAHVVGSAGSGKTALSLSSDLAQLIRNNSGDDAAGGIVISDCKGDNALLHAAREEAEAAGRTFKWFTNLPKRETYVFNPLLQLSDVGLSLPETIGVIAQSLNLYHGEEYGRGYFSAASRALLQAAYRTSFTFGGVGAARPPIESFADLEKALRDECNDPQEFQAAKQLLYVAESHWKKRSRLLLSGRCHGPLFGWPFSTARSLLDACGGDRLQVANGSTWRSRPA